jgi:hypothetical protein
MKWKCSYPPYEAQAEDAKKELRRAGWVFRPGETLCPEHAEVQSLFASLDSDRSTLPVHS